MTILWRISGHDDLLGLGGEKVDGRWHSAARGKPIVYLSEHPALALIEVLANLKGDPRLFPDRYGLMKIAITDAVSRKVVNTEAMAHDWRDRLEATRTIGDTWLAQGHTALLAVPSAPSPESLNYLLNPRHADVAGVSVLWRRSLAYDRRLFHLSDHSQIHE